MAPTNFNKGARFMKKYLFISIFLFAFIASLSGRSKGVKEVKEVNVYEMESFSEVKEDSLVTFADKTEIKQFKKAVNSAKKQPGIVDMADPQYKVELGGKSFFLWLSQDHGTIMDVENTHTIYSLTDKSVENVNNLFR
ncbi:hypothetical protein HMPREF9372_3752 [Sporosarcina newyorkensis 2681]|uniref:YhfM-like domain-containing protein n=2 Tax=Sporosarcina newyorkensis TaxID=759851 RepID=F9DY71_9BACL|nr:hypothetical protein HMPREF9372_3752 [Sporosarcina newyorkensis 2681]